MITVEGAGFSHKLLEHLDKLAARRGHTFIYSAGWELGDREKAALRLVPEDGWQIAIDHCGEIRERRSEDACGNAGCGHRACWIEEACVTELTGLLRQGPPQIPENRRPLAVGRGGHHRLAAHPRHPAPNLTSANPSHRAGKQTPGPVEPPAGPPAGPSSYPGPKSRDQKKRLHATQRQPSCPVKDQG